MAKTGIASGSLKGTGTNQKPEPKRPDPQMWPIKKK